VYEVSTGVRSACNEDGGIVLDIDHGKMFRLNPVGSAILESIGKGYAEAEIVTDIICRYNVSRATALTDVRDFLRSMERHQLIHKEGGRS
jgi:coenzyme PQQ synthesis protein D (PqqD)